VQVTVTLRAGGGAIVTEVVAWSVPALVEALALTMYGPAAA
jgi:hypothetical protein